MTARILGCYNSCMIHHQSGCFATPAVLIAVFLVLFLSPLPVSGAEPTAATELLEKKLASPLPQKERLDVLVQLCESTQESEPKKAVSYGRESLEILEQSHDPALEVRVLLALTWAIQNTGQYEAALEYGQRAVDLALDIDDKKSAALAYNHMGWVYENLSLLDRSLENTLKALKLFEELGDKKNTAMAFKNIGNVYREMKNSKLSLTYYMKALQLMREAGDKRGIAGVTNNIGIVYDSAKQYDKAMEYYREGLAIIEGMNWPRGQITFLANMACVYSAEGDHTRSLEHNFKALEISKKMGQKRMTAILLSNIGVDYRKLKQHEKALVYVYEALDMAKEINNKDIIRNFYEELSYIYDAMKDYEKAFFFLKKYKETDDQIFTEEARKNISDMWLKFNTENKEKEIRWLTQSNRIKQLKLERQELLRNFLLVISLLVLLLAVVLYSRYRTKQKAERELMASEQKLRAMNMSKDKLFSIIAHDLGSPLNSLILSSGYLEKNHHSMEEEDVKEFLHQIYDHSNQMAKMLDNLLHWAVSQLGKLEMNPETLDLCGLAEDTIRLLESSAKDKNIRLISNIAENTLARGDKRMVETIMRNLLSNAVKYSHSGGEVQISSVSGSGFREVTVTDSGVGIPEEKLDILFAPTLHTTTRGTAGEKGIGLGLVLCKELVEKNHGTISVTSTHNPGEKDFAPGTRFTFTLPIGGEEQQ